MSQTVGVSLPHENVAFAGVLNFDGEVVEVLGYGIQFPIDPNEEERASLEELAEAIRGASRGSGG